MKTTGGAGGERHLVTEILDPAHDWELVSEGHGFTEGFPNGVFPWQVLASPKPRL